MLWKKCVVFYKMLVTSNGKMLKGHPGIANRSGYSKPHLSLGDPPNVSPEMLHVDKTCSDGSSCSDCMPSSPKRLRIDSSQNTPCLLPQQTDLTGTAAVPEIILDAPRCASNDNIHHSNFKKEHVQSTYILFGALFALD